MKFNRSLSIAVLAAAALVVGCHTNPKLKSTSAASASDLPAWATKMVGDGKINSVEKLEYNGPSTLYRLNYTTAKGETKTVDINPDDKPPVTETGVFGDKMR